MSDFFATIEGLPISTWLRESNSIWAYPTMLTLHTLGLALLVGASAALDLRVLGWGQALALADLRPLFRWMWIGFWINALSGVVLLAADATTKAAAPMFLIKLGLVAVGVVVMAAQRREAGTTSWTLDRLYDLFPRLKERHAQLAGTLSGGEQQMLAIGRALMGNPRVLLLDEPSEGLAPLIVAEVGRTISRLKAERQSIVLVEQNLKLALDVADSAVILNTGRCVFAGSAAELARNEELIVQNLGVYHSH